MQMFQICCSCWCDLPSLKNPSPLTTWEKLKLNKSWHDCAFHKHGGSLLNNFEDNHVFVPDSEVLYKNLLDEDNVFIFENRTLMHLKLFDESKESNYQINIPSQKIEKCETKTNCKELTDCEAAEVKYKSDVEVNFTNRTYLSWKWNKESVKLLYHRENQLTICRDSINPLKIIHLKAYGFLHTYIRSTRHQSKCTSEEKIFDTGLQLFVDGNKNYSIHMEILSCLNCKMKFFWNCNQFTFYNVPVTDSIITNITFGDGFSSYGWKRMIVGLPQDITNSNCNLGIKTFSERNDSIIQKFWAIASSVAIESLPFAKRKPPSTNTFRRKDKTTNCTPCKPSKPCTFPDERDNKPASKGYNNFHEAVMYIVMMLLLQLAFMITLI